MRKRISKIALVAATCLEAGLMTSCGGPSRVADDKGVVIQTIPAIAPAMAAAPDQGDTSMTLFAYSPPATGQTVTLNAQFSIEDLRTSRGVGVEPVPSPVEEAARPLTDRPCYVGILDRFYRMPTPPITLQSGRYTFQVINRNGRRLTGVLELRSVQNPVTAFASIPVFSSLDDRVVAKILDHEDDPVTLRVQTKPYEGEQPVTISLVMLGSRQNIVGNGPSTAAVLPERTENLEVYLNDLITGSIAFWEAEQGKWQPCPLRFHVPVDRPTYLRLTPRADAGSELRRMYVLLSPNPQIAAFPSAGVTCVTLAPTEQDWKEMSGGAVRRFTGRYTPPELQTESRQVLIYEAIVGNRVPEEKMRLAEEKEMLAEIPVDTK